MSDDPEEDTLLRFCHRAGVLQSEMWFHPVHGLCGSLAGVRKLAEFAPDQARAQAMLQQMEALAGPGKTGLQ